jgi:hypothetical protein
MTSFNGRTDGLFSVSPARYYNVVAVVAGFVPYSGVSFADNKGFHTKKDFPNLMRLYSPQVGKVLLFSYTSS